MNRIDLSDDEMRFAAEIAWGAAIDRSSRRPLTPEAAAAQAKDYIAHALEILPTTAETAGRGFGAIPGQLSPMELRSLAPSRERLEQIAGIALSAASILHDYFEAGSLEQPGEQAMWLVDHWDHIKELAGATADAAGSPLVHGAGARVAFHGVDFAVAAAALLVAAPEITVGGLIVGSGVLAKDAWELGPALHDFLHPDETGPADVPGGDGQPAQTPEDNPPAASDAGPGATWDIDNQSYEDPRDVLDPNAVYGAGHTAAMPVPDPESGFNPVAIEMSGAAPPDPLDPIVLPILSADAVTGFDGGGIQWSPDGGMGFTHPDANAMQMPASDGALPFDPFDPGAIPTPPAHAVDILDHGGTANATTDGTPAADPLDPNLIEVQSPEATPLADPLDPAVNAAPDAGAPPDPLEAGAAQASGSGPHDTPSDPIIQSPDLDQVLAPDHDSPGGPSDAGPAPDAPADSAPPDAGVADGSGAESGDGGAAGGAG